MRAVFVIAWKDLRQRLRDRSAIIAAFVAPMAIALIVSGAFGSGFQDNFSAHYLVVDLDGSELSKAFSEQVLGAPQFADQITVAEAESVAAARELLGRDLASSAFVIPDGFAASVLGNRRTSMEVLRNAEAGIGSEVAAAIAGAFTDQINAARLSVVTATNVAQERTGTPPTPDRIASLARRAAAERIPIRLVDGKIGVREISGANYFGPAMAVFSLFFTTAFVARSMIAERQDGTLPRILAAPIARPALLLGKSASAFVLGLSSFGVIFTVFAVLLDVEWGDPLALLVLTVITVLAVMSLMTFVQTFARTQEGADATGQVITISLALLGGSFFPLFQMPDLMQKVSYLTPNGWAIRGYTDIAYDGATIADIAPNLLAIGGFAIVVGALAMLRSRKLA